MREVERDRPRAPRREPTRTLSGPGPDLQHPASPEPGDRTEQPGLLLVQALRAPDEPVVAEESAVLVLVLVRVAVPPAPTGPVALVVPGAASGSGDVVLVRALSRGGQRLVHGVPRDAWPGPRAGAWGGA